MVGPCFSQRLDRLHSWEYVPVDLPVIRDIVVFKPCCRGKHDVCHLGCGRLKNVTCDEELHLFKRPVCSPCVFSCKQEIASKDNKRSNTIWVSVQNCIPDRMRSKTTYRSGKFVLLPAQHFCSLTWRKRGEKGELASRENRGETESYISSRDVQIACHCYQVDQATIGVHAVQILLDSYTPLDAGWLCRCVEMRSFYNLI